MAQQWTQIDTNKDEAKSLGGKRESRQSREFRGLRTSDAFSPQRSQRPRQSESAEQGPLMDTIGPFGHFGKLRASSFDKLRASKLRASSSGQAWLRYGGIGKSRTCQWSRMREHHKYGIPPTL